MYKLYKCWFTFKIYLAQNNLTLYKKIGNYILIKKPFIFLNNLLKLITIIINENNINFSKRKNMLYLNSKILKISKKKW